MACHLSIVFNGLLAATIGIVGAGIGVREARWSLVAGSRLMTEPFGVEESRGSAGWGASSAGRGDSQERPQRTDRRSGRPVGKGETVR